MTNGSIKEWKKRLGTVFMAGVMVMGMMVVPGNVDKVYAATVSAKQIGTAMAKQGDNNVLIEVEVSNSQSDNIDVYGEMGLSSSSTEVTPSGGNSRSNNSGTITNGTKGTLLFRVDIGRFADEGIFDFPIRIYEVGTDNPVLDTATARINISQRVATGNDGNSLASVDLDYSLNNAQGIIAGASNEMTIRLFNRGNTTLKNTEVSLTLPEGISIDNGAASQYVGYMFSGDRQTTKFTLTASTKLESKNYPIDVVITGKDGSNNDVNIKKTLYIPVVGSGSAASMRDLEITGVSIPQQAPAGDDFTLNFQVRNSGTSEARDLKITVSPTEGIINKTKNIFIESSIAKGSSKSYSVTFFSLTSAEQQSYPIKITVEPVNGDGSDSSLQYASIMLKQAGGSAKTPQLMVDSYNYGGSYVQAGSNFQLSLGLYNTSSSHDLTNIKVTVTSSDGSFIPVNSSNSFFIESIPKKGRHTKSLNLSVKQGAEQKKTELQVDMSYEDGAGNAFNSKDVISIPVMQETRLQVDDVIAPPELYAGMQSGVSVQFYNMGKTVLGNLRITAEGDFDTPESISYFVGNMESGKSDSYDFSFIPREGGTMEGKIIFTYEDASGNEQVYERPFSFEVMADMPDWGGEFIPEEIPQNQGSKWPWFVGGFAVILAAAGVVVWRKLRKRKINQEMEIDE